MHDDEGNQPFGGGSPHPHRPRYVEDPYGPYAIYEVGISAPRMALIKQVCSNLLSEVWWLQPVKAHDGDGIGPCVSLMGEVEGYSYYGGLTMKRSSWIRLMISMATLRDDQDVLAIAREVNDEVNRAKESR